MAAQVVLITGAGRGIGREVALQLARRGYQVAALDNDAAGLQTLKDELSRAGSVCQWCQADVTDSGATATAITELERSVGPINLLVACAGVATDTPALNISAAAIERVIRINLLGVSNTLAAVLPGMLARRSGHVAAVSSLASFIGLPSQMAYCASKAGLNALMESLRLDVKEHGIAVTTLCPGWTQTALTEGRYARADLMTVAEAAQHIIGALERRARFYAFPRWRAWQLRLLRLLPGDLRDYLVARRIRRLRKKDAR